MTTLGEGIKSAAESAKEGIVAARQTVSEGGASALEQASRALETGRDAASRGVNASKDIAAKAIAKSGNSIERNPLAIVLGGIAIGAIVGALLPRTDSEIKVMGKTGKKLNKKAKKMAEAAKAAGKDKVDSLGLNSDAMRDQFKLLVNKAAEAVKAASEAATEAATKKD